MASGTRSKPKTGQAKKEMQWLSCQDCGSMEDFENCGLGEVFNTSEADEYTFSCRNCKLEAKLRSFMEMKSKETVAGIEQLREQLLKIEVKQRYLELEQGKIKEELKLKVESGAVEEIVERIGLIDTAQAEIVVKVDEFKNEWQKISEGAEWQTVTGRRNKAKKEESKQAETGERKETEVKNAGVSFKERCKEKKEGTVVLLGDSMIRGVGEKLKRDNLMFSPAAYGGARIESLTWNLKHKQVESLSSESHLVVMVGTNNLKSEGTEIITRKYEELVDQIKEEKCKKVSMVGILTRGDEDQYLESKRIALNMRLKKLCEKNAVDFVDPIEIYETVCRGRPEERREIETRVLDRWGLRLSDWGQDQVARVLFRHCTRNLN